MFQTLIAVIDDLNTFAVESLSRPFSKTTKNLPSEIIADTTKTQEVDVVEKKEETEEATFKKVADVFASKDETVATEAVSAQKNTVMYVGTTELSVYRNPTCEFDMKNDDLSYGDMVMVLGQKGRWAHVISGTIEGWVLREDLVDRAAHVYPRFINGERNDVDDPNTYRVRAILKDVFGGGKTGLPLQPGEYVLYRLQRKGLRIVWPDVRPRLPGIWHQILKGTPGLHVGVTPKNGSIMEYVDSDGVGYLAYVEAVFPDETINISEVGNVDSGVYTERILTHEEWREFKPVFIQVHT